MRYFSAPVQNTPSEEMSSKLQQTIVTSVCMNIFGIANLHFTLVL